MLEKDNIEKTNPEVVPEEASGVSPKRKNGRRIKLYEITAANDIKFRGPFSYRHFRIFAWLCVAMAPIGFFLSAAANINEALGNNLYWIQTICKIIGNLSLPFFLIASFAVILNAKDGYKRLIILYALSFAVCILGFFVIYNHYLVGLVNILSEGKPEAIDTLDDLIYAASGNGFIAFNIFVDLLQFTLFTCFINYYPVKRFQGKKIVIFRLFALIPIIYEIVSFTLKTLSATGNVVLSVYVFPFLTTKSPVLFLLFLPLAFFIKVRERIFKKHNKSLSDYKAFLKTNANSLHFAVYTCITIVIVVLIDLIVFITVAAFIASSSGGGEAIAEAFATASSLGFGGAFGLLITIPFVLLFSYTKTYQNDIVDKFIPFGGVAFIMLVVVEGAYRMIELLM
ncbi:MAG: hypothetical protein J5911_04675 [Clostridia bacterium]|nr:hypothetical protein [Clostridia bacterium]